METPTGHFDGWYITEVLAHLHRLAFAPSTETKKEPEEPPREEEEEPAGYFGFCDVCGHTHAFCTCEDEFYC